jgi:hypothetical protein
MLPSSESKINPGKWPPRRNQLALPEYILHVIPSLFCFNHLELNLSHSFKTILFPVPIRRSCPILCGQDIGIRLYIHTLRRREYKQFITHRASFLLLVVRVNGRAEKVMVHMFSFFRQENLSQLVVAKTEIRLFYLGENKNVWIR